MNICHIAPIYFNIPNGRSGPGRVFYNLNEELYKINNALTVYACQNSVVSGQLKYLYPVELNSYEPFNKVTGADRGKFLLNHISYALKQEKNSADVFQTHAVEFALPIASLVDNKVIITLHRPIDQTLIDFIKLFNTPNVHFVTVSNNQSKLMKANFDNVTTIYNGIETDLITPENNKKDYVVFVGRLEENKGADIAIKAAIEANTKIVVIGKPRKDNPESEAFFSQQIEPLLSNPLVEYISEVEHFKLFEIYKGAKALLFPLRNPDLEAFGLVSVEAMASGTPVIALRNPLMEEVISDKVSGILVDKETDLGKAIQEIKDISPVETRKWAEKFSRENMAKQYLTLYEKLIK